MHGLLLYAEHNSVFDCRQKRKMVWPSYFFIDPYSCGACNEDCCHRVSGNNITVLVFLLMVSIWKYSGWTVCQNSTHQITLCGIYVGVSMNIGHKIIVLGCSGSGKSTFSKKLHEITGLPLVHLDNIWWKSDKTHISRNEFDQKLNEILHEDRWIIDGDYSRTYEVRFKSCDTVFFLDYSFNECMHGIKERVGKERTDIPWTEQRLDPELVKLVENYEKDDRPVVLSLIKKYSDRNIFVFKSRIEADEWILRIL